MKTLKRLLLLSVVLSSSIFSTNLFALDTEDKVAIITGSSFGLGRELTQLARDSGMKLVLVDIRPEPSEALVEEITAAGGGAIFVEADLAIAEERPQIIERAMDTYGRIDFLFNNAGYAYLSSLEAMSLDDAHHIFEVNYWAYVDLAQRVIEPMRSAGGGTIVNTASILGVRPSPPTYGHYGATKHALLGLFQTAAKELATDNIKVIIAAPAGMKTNIGKHAKGPAVDPGSDISQDWEDPAIAARDIFDALDGDDVVIYPGYIGRQMQGQ
ncbi:SDR family NAD(P)-dependent oxidoreductase [Congregibacter sp.]|uniref:SDR family NAD(P)-dependent oxidoreductase n=1 Tax=Congregibacter sp. TaxID=2744308 RepID=UPI003F6B0764